MASLSPIFLSLSFLVCSAFAAPSPSTVNACKALASAVPGAIYYQNDQAYKQEAQNYWSVALKGVLPACMALPSNAQQVSTIVKTLGQYSDVDWVVKSGGHDPNPGHSAIQDGIVVAMAKIKGVTYNSQTKTAEVLPGGHWTDVIGPLDKQGVTVVGGRLGLVGIGGYLTQGGISFLSAQYGMATDNVIGFETVLANGSIVNVTPESNKDLMVAMRGSGSQFGIVTKFTMETHPIGKVWGGYRIYGDDMGAKLFAGLHEFINNNEKDPKAAVIVNSGGPVPYMVYFFYDGPQPPKGAFGSLFDVPAVIGFLTDTRSYTDLLGLNGFGADLLGKRTSFRTMMLPYSEDRPNFYREIEQKWNTLTAPLKKADNTMSCTLAYQAFPHVIGKQTAKRGGNAMGLTANDPNRFVVEITCQWGNQQDSKSDDQVYALSKQLTDAVEQEVVSMKVTAAGAASSYMPLFMNDAAWDQDVFSSYKDVAKFRALQKQADPSGMFLKRVGGFSYAGVPQQRAPVKL